MFLMTSYANHQQLTRHFIDQRCFNYTQAIYRQKNARSNVANPVGNTAERKNAVFSKIPHGFLLQGGRGSARKRRLPPKIKKKQNNRNKQWSIVFCPSPHFFPAESQVKSTSPLCLTWILFYVYAYAQM